MATQLQNRAELASKYRDHLRVALAEARRTDAAKKFADGEAKDAIDAFSHHRLWESLTDATGQPFPGLIAFIEAPEPFGLNLDSDTLQPKA